MGRREIVGLGAAAFVAGGFSDVQGCTISAPPRVDEPGQRAQRIGAAKKFINQVSNKDWTGLATAMGDEPWKLNGTTIAALDPIGLKRVVTAALLPDYNSFEFQDAAVLADRVFASAMLWYEEADSDCGAGPFGQQNYLAFAFRDRDLIRSVEVTND